MGEFHLAAGALLRCFFSQCERKFRFLEERHGYNFFYGLVEYRKNFKLIKAVESYDISGSFQAIVRYEKDEQALEMLYGSEQFQIEGYAYYNAIDRYTFSEILKASRKQTDMFQSDWGLTDPKLIEKTVSQFAYAVEKNARVLLDSNPKVLERANTIRNALLEQTIRQYHAEMLKRISEDAARAFREKNYRRVIELLNPHKEHLKKAELKKLQRAEELLRTPAQ